MPKTVGWSHVVTSSALQLQEDLNKIFAENTARGVDGDTYAVCHQSREWTLFGLSCLGRELT